MLVKLLKYDLKWLLKIVCVFLIIGIVFSVLGRLLEFCPNSLFFNIIKGIVKGIGLALTISALFNSVIRPWVRLTNNMYNDESYLSNTLPVSRSKHYLSKCLSGLICVVLSVTVLLLNVFIMYYSKSNIQLLKDSLNLVATTLDVSIIGFILLVFLVILFEVLFILQCGYFGIILGHTYNKIKLLKTFIFGFGSYMVCSTVSLILIVIMSLFNEGLASVVLGGSTVIEFGLLKFLMIYVCVVYVIYIAVLYYINNKILSKGINIE